MTDFEAWAKMCAEFNTDIYPIYKATDRPECGLYMTKGSYWVGNTKFYHSPVYQVWIDDNREIAVMDMYDAIAYWNRRAKEEGIEYTSDAEKMRRMRFNT